VTANDRLWAALDTDVWFPAEPPYTLRLNVRETGRDLAELSAWIRVVDGHEHGQLVGPATVAMERTGPDLWEPAEELVWVPHAALDAGPEAVFAIRLLWDLVPGQDSILDLERSWLWDAPQDPFDFTTVWPGGWTFDHPTGDGRTVWHRWTDTAALRPGGAPILACTGVENDSAADWPEVRYSIRADAALVSPWFDDRFTAVRLEHHVDIEILHGETGVDAAVLEWESQDGTITPGEPHGGYPGRIAGGAAHALHGRPAWTVRDSLLPVAAPRWRVDVVPRPSGPGPWRLRLRLASSPEYQQRGWLIADIAGITEDLAEYPLPATWLGTVGGEEWLFWRYDGAAEEQRVEASSDGGATWQEAWTGIHIAVLPEDSVRLDELSLPPPGTGSLRLRVVMLTPAGEVALRPVVWERPTSAVAGDLGQPYPNPAAGELRVVADPGGDASATLGVFDLRGRLLRSWDLGGVRTVVAWDGRDHEGRRVAAGAYIFRLTTSTGTHTRKATRLP
jgi:hypothetical protein